MARRVSSFAKVPEALGGHIDAEELLDLFAEGDAQVGNTAFVGLELSYEDAGSATFDTVAFRGCTFDGVDFSGCTFRDVRFQGCRFIRCSMDRAWLNRCDMVDCSAPGLSLLQARLAGVAVSSSDLSYANLSECTVDVLCMRAVRLIEAAMQRTRLKRVELDGCDLTRIDVFRTPLAGIDLSTCEFAAPVLSSDFRELRGAKVSVEQALALVGLLGVTVADD